MEEVRQKRRFLEERSEVILFFYPDLVDLFCLRKKKVRFTENIDEFGYVGPDLRGVNAEKKSAPKDSLAPVDGETRARLNLVDRSPPKPLSVGLSE